jgi:hypothetical protein
MLAGLSFRVTPITVAQSSTGTTLPASADLAKRVDDLEKQLNELKAQLKARRAPVGFGGESVGSSNTRRSPGPYQD